MVGFSSTGVLDRLGKHFYPLAIASVVLTLGMVLIYLPTRFAIFGLYAFLGLVGGAVIYYRSDELAESYRYLGNDRVHRVGVYVAGAVTLGAVALTGEPMIVSVGLVVGYTLLVRQFIGRPNPERMLPQLAVLFLLSPAVKYLTAGRYVGHGDLLYHVRLVESILVGESIDAIAAASYYDLPGLHVIAATVGSVSGLGAYDGIMVTGLVAYALVVPAVYLLALRLTGDPILALSTAFAIAVLKDVSFFVSYAFPQSIATVLIVVLLVLGSMASRDAIKWRVAGVFTVVAVALALTHHLTQVLFLPLVGCFLAGYVIFEGLSAARLVRSRYLGLLGIALLSNGVSLWSIGFYDRLSAAFRSVVEGGLFGGYTQSVTLGFGMTPPSSSLALAFDWLLSPYALYLVVLFVVFSLGVVAFLRSSGHSSATKAAAVTGLVGALLILDNPLSIKSLIRIGFPWQFAFAFVVGIGIQQVRLRCGSIGYGRLLIAVLVVLAAVTPLVTADNYYGLDPRPTEQTSFTEQEFSELRATESFVGERTDSTTVFWDTRLVMNRFESTGLERGTVRGDDVFLPAGHFVYRSGFSDHKISFTVRSDESLYSNDAYMSEEWLSHRVETGNHVYTAGETGTLWNPTERPL